MVTSIICLVAVIALAWYVLVERPAVVAGEEQQRLHAALQPGDQIVTIEGVHATVQRIDGMRLLVTVAGGEWLTIDAGAIAGRSSGPTQGATPAATLRVLGSEFTDAASRWFGGAGAQGRQAT